jgi:hypothetical protein
MWLLALKSLFITASVAVAAGSDVCTGASTNLVPADCQAWIDLYDAMGGASWSQQCSGNRLDPCQCNPGLGYGVLCSGGHITNIGLGNHNNGVGTIPETLAAMTKLVGLGLGNNITWVGACSAIRSVYLRLLPPTSRHE